MIEYETKTINSKFKIGDSRYDIKIIQQHSDSGPKITICADAKIDSNLKGFHIEITELDVIEAHTALTEVINTLATITHVHYAANQMGHPAAPLAAPCVR